jgi:Ca-activated chloride channel family protein
MTRFQTALLAAASLAVLASCASQTSSDTGPGDVAAATEEKQEAERGLVAVTGAYVADGRGDRDVTAPPPPSSQQVGVLAEARRKAAGEGYATYAQAAPQPLPGTVNRENYENVEINGVKLVTQEPVSTFSIDVDTASYANVRRMLNNGHLPPKDAVRIEELINYFDYDYALPKSKDTPFETTVTVVPSPWSKGRQLMHIGVQGYDINRESRPPLNLTLLIDVSGSMSSEDKLPLAIKSLKLLVNELAEKDKVSIAVYAGAAGTVLEPTSDKARIVAALDRLSAGGSTAGGEGLRLAYNLAKQNFSKNSVNRVMLLTDGDFNVGINDPEALEDFVSRERESGVYLSVLGFGQGNYNDLLMQKLAQSGNGMAAYVDNLNEARKILNDDLSGSMFSIANDVKIQVEFNPAKVAEYRLIGYETRLLKREDFNNDKVDAGEIGAGTSVTAVYELTPVGSSARLIDPSRYQQTPQPTAAGAASEYAFLKLRYKTPGADTSKLVDRAITDKDAIREMAQAPESTRFATAVAAYGSMLRGDPYIDKAFTWDSVIDLANGAKGKDAFGYRAEFIQLARLARTAASQAPLNPPGSGALGQ